MGASPFTKTRSKAPQPAFPRASWALPFLWKVPAHARARLPLGSDRRPKQPGAHLSSYLVSPTSHHLTCVLFPVFSIDSEQPNSKDCPLNTQGSPFIQNMFRSWWVLRKHLPLAQLVRWISFRMTVSWPRLPSRGQRTFCSSSEDSKYLGASRTRNAAGDA